MAVGLMRWRQCLLCEELTLFRAEIATDAGRLRTPTNDGLGTRCARETVRMRLSHGVAID
jgi:hypothetical protein